MPRYFFHLHNGSEQPDREGSDLADMGQVRSEAVRLSSEVLRDMDERFWGHPEWTLTVTVRLSSEVLRDMDERFWGHPEWTLTVTDETGAELLGLGCQ